MHGEEQQSLSFKKHLEAKGFEVTVPGHQGFRALRDSIPLAGVPTSFETSLRGLLLYSPNFLHVVSVLTANSSRAAMISLNNED